DFGYSGDSWVITLAPKSEIRFSSAARSTIDSQFEICSATSLPIPSILRSSSRLAARTRSGRRKTSRSLRNRTGPIVGNMLSAIHASVEFIECERAIELDRSYVAPTPQAACRSKWNFVFVRLGRGRGFGRCNWFADAPGALTLIP